MEIRVARPSDLDDILVLMRRVYRSFGEWPPADEAVREFVIAQLENPARLRFIVAEDEGALVGMLSVAFCETSFRLSRFGWVDDFHVVERVRGRGVGRALLRFACDHAREAGAIEVKLTAAASDPRLARLYREAGFRPSALPLLVLPLDKPPQGAA